jgi:D-aminopeptidase
MEGGGQSIATEATALLGPDLMTLAVKEAVSRFASRGLPIVRARG